MRRCLPLAAALLPVAAVCQGVSIPVPGFGSTFSSSNLTHGYFFRAPIPLSIVGYGVPDEASFGTQNCEIYVFSDSSSPGGPPAWPSRYTATAADLRYADYGRPVTGTPISIGAPILVNANDWICVLGACGDGSIMHNSTATPSGPFTTTLFGQSITLARCGTQNNIASTPGPNALWSEVNGPLARVDLYVAPLPGFATATAYGGGCGGVADYATAHEHYPRGGFDLGGAPGTENVIRALFHGAGYSILPGGSAWFTPAAPDLGLRDDSVSTPQPLGFNFPLPGGASIADIVIGSNGYVWLDPAATGVDLSGSIAELTAQPPRIAMCWMDLQPGSGGGSGTVHFDTDPANGVAYVTFVGVQEFGAANRGVTVDMQLALFSSGNWELRYGTETIRSGTDDPLVGFSPGNGALIPPEADLSILPIFTQPDQVVPDLSLSSNRPVEGSTMVITVDNIAAGTVLGTLILGATRIDPGIQPFPGLGTCVQHVGLADVFYYLPARATETIHVPVPTGLLTGAVVHGQAVTLSPGLNALGVASSNGLEWLIDRN